MASEMNALTEAGLVFPGETIPDALLRTMKLVFGELYDRQNNLARFGGYESDCSNDSAASELSLTNFNQDIYHQVLFFLRYVSSESVIRCSVEKLLLREGGCGVGEFDIHEMGTLMSMVVPVDEHFFFLDFCDGDGIAYGSLNIELFPLYAETELPGQRFIIRKDGYEPDTGFCLDYEEFMISAVVNKEFNKSIGKWCLVFTDIYIFHPIFFEI